MRRFMPPARSYLIRFGQTAGLLSIACLAMAAAPLAPVFVAVEETDAIPVAAPVTAVAKPAGPMMRALVFAEPVPGHAINSKFGMRRLGGEPGVRQHHLQAVFAHVRLQTSNARLQRRLGQLGTRPGHQSTTHDTLPLDKPPPLATQRVGSS